jgi:phosphatidylserine/phosphatidylglycerophosphate/cardiolipin synthase-like enzyme
MYAPAAALRPGDAVDVEVATEPSDDGRHGVYFNRGVAGSQAYTRKFGNHSPLDVPEAQRWMSRGLEEALLAFIARATGAGWRPHGAFYEFFHAPVLQALHQAALRGVDVRLAVGCPSVANWPDYPSWQTSRRSTCARAPGRRRRPGCRASCIRGATARTSRTTSSSCSSIRPTRRSRCGRARRTSHPARSGATPTSATPSPTPPSRRSTASSRGDSTTTWKERRSRTSTRPGPRWPRSSTAPRPRCSHHARTKGRSPSTRTSSRRPPDRDLQVTAGAFLGKPGGWRQFLQEHLTGLNDHVKYIHTKYLIVDPLTDDPTVVTGSANFSKPSTVDNDENMLVIRGSTRVADIYLTEFMRLFTHMRFRSAVVGSSKEARAPDPAEPDVSSRKHLHEDDKWVTDFYVPADSPKARERRLFSGGA